MPNTPPRGPKFHPAFDRYEEIVRPNVELRVPAYFMKNWAPILSPGAVVLYLQLRFMCFYDTKNPENSRDYCWPSQKTLATLTGQGARSIFRYLKELELHGLIWREAKYEYNEGRGKKVRSVDWYHVPHKLPLLPEDMARLAIQETEDQVRRSAEHPENVTTSPTRQIGNQVKSYPHSHRPTRQFGDGVKHRQFGDGNYIPEIVHNVINVDSKTSKSEAGQTSLMLHPQVQSLTGQQREECERRAFEIGEQLKRMAGDRSEEDHPSAGFHKRVAFLMPHRFIDEALTSTRDALEDQHSGRKNLNRGPAAYFAGIIRRIALREGIDLGIDWSSR